MKQHEREFFIAQIRSGKVVIKQNDKRLIVNPLSFDQSVEACEIYNEAYQQAYIDGIMDDDEMDQWMREHDLWTLEDDEKTERFKKDLERLKIEIYNARNDESLREKIRLYLRIGEKQFAHHLTRKNLYHQNTREGFATSEKVAWIIKNCTTYDNKPYDFSDISLNYVTDEWQSSFLNDTQSRELARNEPWKSLWVIRENSNAKLFNNSDTCELTYNQKNLLIWSQMYDNIQESTECPPKEVIDDDDILDGWFIIQAKKRENERIAQDFDNNTKSDKIKNSSEVFIVSKDTKSAEKIHGMNSLQALQIKQQRAATLKERGSVEQQNFADERLNIQMQQTNQFRGKIRGG
jgi:hypothetical protein